MSSVTPQRRHRDDEDVEGFDNVSVDGEGSVVSSQARKRTRLGEDLEQEELVSDDTDRPILPDNYRRSPKGKGRATDTATPGKHQPGSIVRVKLTDFVTYSSAEFHPGPNLNMIIGPNGTGKSTLVCAICIGLGFKPEHLGRAKQLNEFVKNGTKRAEIEIELAANPDKHDRNPVVTTRINRADKSATHMVNGRMVTKKEMEKLMRSFSIQIDNLCQFLPQDRVVEFAAMNPVAMLAETQRAAAPERVVQWHEQLKTMSKEQKAKQKEQQNVTEILQSAEKRHESQQGDVQRIRERQEAQKQVRMLEKVRPVPEYMMAIRAHAAAKQREKAAKKEKVQLERQLEPNLQAENDKAAYLRAVENAAEGIERLEKRSEAHAEQQRQDYEKKKADVDKKTAEMASEKESVKKVRQSIPQLQQDVRRYQNEMANPPAEVDIAALNADIQDKQRKVRSLNERIEEAKTEMGSLIQQKKQQQDIKQRAETQREYSHTQAGQQANKLRQASPDAARAWEWVQNNRGKFKSDIFGPPIVECSLKNPRNAAAVENAIRQNEMIAFTVTSSEDFRTLTNQLRHEMGLSAINIRTVKQGLDHYKRPCDEDHLRTLGLEAWIVDLIEGPEPVLAMLCDNRGIHATGFTSRELSPQQMETLTKESSCVSSWVTRTDSWSIARRQEYNATSTRSNPLRPARYWTDAPAALNADAELDGRIAEVDRVIEELDQRYQVIRNECREVNAQKQTVEEEEKAIRDEKKKAQNAKTAFDALGPKLRHARGKLADAKEMIRTSRDRENELIGAVDQLTLEKAQKSLDYANAIQVVRDLHNRWLVAQMTQIEAESDLMQLKERTQQEKEMIEARAAEVARLAEDRIRLLRIGKEWQEKCKDLQDDEEFDEGSELNALYRKVHEESWEPARLQTEIDSAQARLDMTGVAGGEHTIREFEERAKKIERSRDKLAAIEADLAALDSNITEIRSQWEPELDRIIARISDAFAENFSQIQCAGEVAVHKDEDFEQWAIQIKVKFREHEPLTILDSHRQSGGERAVSTIFYLMALQSMARAPFRVVDEINQGMDPRNERLVHSRMVDIACGEESASQYFLITPKLLNGLKYHERMRVHCIASGENLPSDYKELDFRRLAARALAVKGRG
ncbi:putative ABC/SMC5 protein [Teratosphaeria destructans]|uniref:Structural maintenance of chromosomes protein 5 n=1 Tax=Teratosphaeria destructans TaxID=418781 RepID=A0A9W7SKH7_9PEZI|nr:putative ABC/SMC5 protein [Teratosphaeria destructans]